MNRKHHVKVNVKMVGEEIRPHSDCERSDAFLFPLMILLSVIVEGRSDDTRGPRQGNNNHLCDRKAN